MFPFGNRISRGIQPRPRGHTTPIRAAAWRGRESRRRMLLQELEPRHLLSNVPLTPLQRDTLSDHLNHLVDYAESVESAASLGRPLPLVGQSFASHLDLSDVLRERFTGPLGQYLAGEGLNASPIDIAAFLTSEAVVGRSDGLSFAVGPTTGTLENGDVVIDTTLYASRSVDYTFDAAAAAELGIRFPDADASGRTIELGMTWDLRFGVDAAGGFFAGIDLFRVEAVDAIEIIAERPMADPMSLTHPVTLDLLINGDTAVAVTLPPITPGNRTPLSERLTTALVTPLRDAGWEGAVTAVDRGGHLALRVLSPEIHRLELVGGQGSGELGFTPAVAHDSGFGPPIAFGLLDLDTHAAGVVIAGRLDIVTDAGSDGVLDASELLSPAVTDLLPRGGSKAMFRVSPAVDSVALPEEPTIHFASDFVFANSPLVVGLEKFGPVDVSHDAVTATLREGFDSLTAFAARLESFGHFGNSIAGLSSSLGGAIDFDEVFRQQLQRPVADLLGQTPRPSWADVRDALESVPGVTVTGISESRSVATIDIHLESASSVSDALVMGPDVTHAGLAVAEDSSLELMLDASLAASFRIEIDRQRAVSPGEAFAVRFDSLQASAAASSTIDFPARVGLLGLSATGSAELDAGLAATVAGGQAIAAGRLRERPMSEMVATESTGGFAIDLALTGTIGNQTLTAGLELPSGNPFDGTLGLQPIGFASLNDFRAFGPGDIAGGLGQMGQWFGDFSAERMGVGIPMTLATRLSDAVDFTSAFGDRLVEPLTDDEGMLTFSTAQTLASVAPGIVAVDYDAVTHQLFFELEFDAISQPLTADLGFDWSLGDLVGLATDAGVELRAGVESHFRIGVDLRPLGQDVPAITLATPLDALNGGRGVMIDPGDEIDDIEVQLRSGDTFRVRFASVTTVGQAIDRIHAARDAAAIPASDFAVGFRSENGKAVGLRMTDKSPDQGVDFRIRNIDGSVTGFGLGLVGFDEDGDGVIDGGPLHGDTFADRLFIEPIGDTPIASGKVELSGSNVEAQGNLGFLAVQVEGGRFVDAAGQPSFVSVAVALVDSATGTTPHRVSLADLFRSLDSRSGGISARASLDGRIGLELPVRSSVAASEFGGTVRVSLSGFDGQASTEVEQAFGGDWADLVRLDAASVLDGLRDALARLLDLDSESAFAAGLPIVDAKLPSFLGLDGLLKRVTESIESIGESSLLAVADELGRLAGEPITLPEIQISLPDLVGFVASIRDRVGSSGGSLALPDLEPLFRDHFGVRVTLPDIDVETDSLSELADRLTRRAAESQLSGAGSLQQLESVLESALGLAPDSLALELDTSTPGSLAVRVDLTLSQTKSGELPLKFDLGGLDVAGVGNLIDVSGSSKIGLSAGVAFTLSLGLDVTATGVQPFLYQFDPVTGQGTHVTLTAGGSANEIEFDASLGPIGVAIARGSAGINRTGIAGDSDPAAFLVTVAGGSDGRVILGDTLTLETQVSGGAFASLPLEIPRGTPIATIEYSSSDLTAKPAGDSLNVSDVKAAIEDRIATIRDAGIGSNLLAMVGGWEGGFDLLIDAMRGEVLGVPLPLIGDALADEADFLEDIKRSVISNIAGVADQGVTLVQRGIFDALGPGGLNLLQDATGDGMLTPDDVQFTFDSVTNRVDFDLHLRKAVQAVELPIRFDLGLPGLNLDIDAPVQLSFGADFRLGFGVSLDEGFFFATDPSRTQLELFFKAQVPQLSAAGQLAFLDIIASTIPGSPTRFDGTFIVNLSDDVVGDGNGLLSFDEMVSGSFSDAIEHTLAAKADVDLNLVVSMGDSSLVPRMRTDLIVDWEFIAGQGLNAPEVRFENVQLNLGDFFGGFVGEVLGQVQDVLRPVQPMIDLLTARLPVISDLSGSRVTLVDMARLFGRADVANFAQSVIDVNNLVTGLPQVGPDSWIDLGAFGVAAGALGGFSGPGSTAGSSASGGSGPRAAVSMIDVQVESDPLGQAAARGGSRGGTWTNNLSNAKGSLRFPLLQNPMTAFQLLLGRDVDLFLYDAPALGIDFTYSQFFPIPAMPILGAEIAGRLAAVVDFAFGFDTTGIRKFQQSRNFVDIFDGFFVSDRENPDGTGRDVPEAYLRGSLTAGAKLELLIAEAGVRGGIFASVDFNLHDNDGDGRVRGGELAENFALGPIHIFDVSGRVDAGLVAFVDVDLLLFTLHEEFEIARANLLNFEIRRPVPGGLSPTEILTSRAGDVLTIHFTEQDDNYRVFPGSVPNSIVVQGQGMQTVDLIGIKEIHGNALGGDDIVTISPDVMIPVWIDGGEGNDQLTAGGGRAVLRGGPGNDVLIGGPADDHLIGGPGDDRIFGGDGNDLLEGNDGDDYIDGGRGDDVILGGAGDDVLIGGRGNDIIEGGEGNDIIDGGPGNDILRGGPGDDQISGGRGDDVIEGGPGNDILLGGPGNDVIHGGDGDDIIDGGEGDDIIYGGAGHDIIDGGTGNDWIDGGDGDDVIRGGGGSDTIFGGAGNDVIYADDDEFGNPEAAPSVIHGGPGDDLIYGSLGDDRIFGGPGDDTIFALAGNDWIEGGDGNDTIDAGPGDDVVIGGRGDDVIDGGDGNDLLWGGSLVYGPEHFNLGDPSLFELPPRFEEARAFGGSTYSPPLLITPKIVGGLSIDGSPSDGNNVIRGGDGNDWIFGGGGDDTLYGGPGHDYLDGGAGQDTLFGGDGDDVLRGGKGNDVLHGGAGIDQLYGDEGNDTLYGDAGTADGSTDGQRLFGGAGDDRLFAWAAGDATDRGAIGDELWGGPGNDFLYGNGRNDLLVGEEGNDFLHGDWARGPKYAQNPFAALNFDPEGNPIGSDDRLYGGPGNDQLFGGGGDDLLVGGPGDDWLEGQDGHDTLIGGSGTDFLVLDVDPRYQVVGGGRIDGHGDDSPDDHATDVLLINGTAGDDVIRLRTSTAGEPIRRNDGEIIGNAVGGQLMVEYNQARIEVVWSEFGIPLIDQFRISGLGGDDWIEFVRGEQALDLTPLIDRSRDFVAVIDGGPGNDTLLGTPGRDRIDGGRGSDVIFGFEGDDRLWGDQGANDGSVTDHDIIFAGSGNDDVLGGQGTNDLFAWSLDPRVGSSFGVYLGSDGNLYQEIDEDLAAAGITFELEDTGLNRIIGSSRDDRLYGGTGVDLLYGGGGNDQLFTRDGTPFEDLDEQQAGDEWKAYARSSQHVWYVGGTNADDVISVDFVTEPGILQGHHLVTRLTNNNGSFSFDAQVRLDFSATDGDGNLIWDPNDLLADIDGLQSDNPFTRAEALDRRFSDAVRLSRFLPSEGDFQVIIIDALAGDDVITVGPTVQKSVWIDAGEGDDIVRIESGRAILIDQTDPIDNRNDSIETAFPLVGPAVLIGTAAAPDDGILTADARFRLIVDDLDQHVVIDIPAALTDGTATGTQPNASLDDLVDDINGVLSRSAAAGRVIASRSGDRIALSTTKAGPATRLAISIAAGNPAITQLGLSANDSAVPSSTLRQSTTFRGLTIDNPADVDHYQFELLPAALSGDNARITVGSISRDDGMKLALFVVGETVPIIEGIDATVGIDLQALGVQAGTSYVLRVSSDAIPTIYDVRFDFGDGVTSLGVDLGAVRDFPRRDVIFGGPGNDVLQGGPGEDFIFGGPGNDVLTGGRDGGASDLLFGGEGDDTFLVIPDALPRLTGTDLGFIPTQSDRFDGGEGNNRVMFLGGDMDRRGVPIDDFVSLRFNRLLQRYEVSTLVWDINHQRYIPSESSADLSRGELLRHWHFYTTTGIDSTVFDLAAGDDTVRLDPGFIFPGDSTLTTWGIASGDLQAGAEALRHIEVHGGPGNDRLFGGATDEILLGGDGADFISGGLGNDWIEGGPGNDVLAGGSAIAPDRLEFVSRSFGSGPNDTFQFASDLPRQVKGSTVRDLSFHQGDPADWYVLRPQANFRFAGQSVAALRKEMIRAAEVDSVGGQTTETGETFRFSLFLAEVTGDATEPALVPVDVLPGAAEYLLLRVDNQLMTENEPSLLPRRYELQFLAPLGESINVSVEALARHDDAASEPLRGFSRPASDIQIRVGNQNVGGQGVVIPVGDFNGDGSDDYILSVRDGVDLGDGGGLVSYARLVYGDDPLLSPSAVDVSPTSGTVLIVPGRLFASGDGPRASIRPAGDIDGDGVDDLLVSISDGVSQGDVFIVFGSAESPATIDLRDPSIPGTTIVRIAGFDDRLEATAIGDVNDDGLTDFVVIDGSGGHLFLGRGPHQWEKQSESVLPGGRPAFDFSDGSQGFATTHNFFTRNPWSVTGGRLVFGGGTYENTLAPFNMSFPARARAASPLIDLRGVTDPVLHFDHLLRTERRLGADIARVLVEVNGKTIPLQGATNQGAGLLPDGMNPGGPMAPLSFALDPFAGSQIRLLFDFDSVDQFNNNFFGWALDNIRVEGTTGLKIDDADTILPGTIRHLRALNDFDGDGFADFGYLSDSELRIYFGSSDVNQLSSLVVPGDFGDGALFVAERLNDDALPDAVISGPQASWLVLSNGREQPTIEQVPVGGLQPIGDFTNDGYTDLAVGVLEFTDAVTDSGVESNQNAHWVVHLHASADLPQRLDRLREATPRPDLVLQLPDAVFATVSNASVLRPEAPLFGSLGDLSGDGVDDLAVFSPLRASMHVIFGDVIMAADEEGLATDGRLPIETPSPRLIPPTRGLVGPIRQVGIDLSRDPSPLLRDAMAIEGRHVDEHLQGARPIGDVNGDGFIDVVVSGENVDYLVFGPFPVDGVSRVDRVANVTIVGGRVAGNYGDLNGDGIDDLVVIRERAGNDGGWDVTFDVHFGGNEWNRKLEQAPDLTLLAGTNWPRGSVGAALLDWDGSGHHDLLTTYDAPRAGTLASLQAGIDLTGTPLAVFKFDPTQAATPEGYILNEEARFTIRPIGDFDGDGRDDLAFASPNLFTPEPPASGAAPLGVVFLVLGGRTGQIDLLRDSDAMIQSPALGEILSPLGDINQDGYDDLAVSRSRESLGELAGGLLVFHGRASLRDDLSPMPVWGAEDAAIRLSREGVGSLVSGTYIAGPLHAVAGDIDANGRVDLIVGSPSQTIIDSATGLALQQNRRGEVAVFFDAESLTGEVAWGQRDRSIRGSTSGDRAGQLAPGPLVDVDADGLVDLFIGASGFDGLIDGIRRDAGRVYFIGGTRSAVTLPNDSDVEVLENFQGMLVDRQTGQPESFGTMTLAGDEAWFRFTTGGDGFGDENRGDFVRITPGASTEPIRSAPSASGGFAADGTVAGHDVLRMGGFDNNVAVLEFDLRSVADVLATTSVVPDVTLNFSLRSTANSFTLGEMRQFTRVGERLYFVGTDPVEGTGLYITDGTDEGTMRLDLGVGANPENLMRVDDDLFFTAHANSSASTVELWKSDGTGQGTAKVTDIHITAESFATGGGKLYFVTRGGREVWESDGTADLTFPRELSSLLDPTVGFDPASLVVSVSDLESQPILFLSGKNTKYTEPVLFASPGQNSNDGRTIQMVGDDGIGTRHREPTNMMAFDGFLAFQRTDPTGEPSPLLVTNGVIEPGASSLSGFSLQLTPTRPNNPSGFLVVPDDHRLVAGDFTRAGDYQEWLDANLPLDRDVLYFFADGPGGVGRSVYRLHVNQIRDNGMRNGSLVTRENLNVSLTLTEVASQVPANARSLVLRGDELFFIADSPSWGGEVFRIDRHFTTAPGWGQVPSLVSDINRNAADSDPRDLVVLGGNVYFTASDGVSRGIYRVAEDGSLSRFSRIPQSPHDPERLSVVGNRVLFVADDVLWSTDGTVATPIRTSAVPETELSVGILNENGDGLVTPDDLLSPLLAQIDTVVTGNDAEVSINLTSAIATAIGNGFERITLRIGTPVGTAGAELLPSLDPGRANTRLEITPRGLLLDLISERGELIKADQTLVDLRTASAGTYYLRVHRGHDALVVEPIDFELQIDAPTLGQYHTPSNRNRIFGGDGDDRLSGGSDLDTMFGQSGLDVFQGESVEVFDLDPGAGETLSPPAVEDLSHQPLGPRPDQVVLTGDDINPRLRAAIAEALGRPVTIGFTGNPIVRQPIYASEVAELERLDLSGLGLSDLRGLEHATRLRFLDLSDNLIDHLSLPGAYSRLEVLDLSNNRIGEVNAAELFNLPVLKRLYLDGNQIRDLSALVGITIVDDGDPGYTEAGSWQSEASATAGAWLDDYRFTKSGGSATWTVVVPIDETVRLWVTWPRLENESSSETTYRVFDGESLLATLPVFQATPAGAFDDDAMFGGRPWENLGEFASTSGELQIVLSGADGAVVAADAVRAERVSLPSLSLKTLSLLGNPLNDVSRDALLGRLQATNPELNILVTPNENAPTIAPIANQTVRHGSLSFHDDVVVLPHQVLNGLGSFMVDFWFRADRIADSAILSAAKGSGAGADNEFLVVLYSASRVRVLDRGATHNFDVGINLNDGQWHHYAIVRDGSAGRLRLFVDGRYVGERAISTASITVAAGGLVLGQEQDSVGGSFQTSQAAYGQLDELRIWDRFWSANDQIAQRELVLRIREIKDQAVSGSDPDLRAYYAFDEATGSVVTDSGPNGWNGTLGNGLPEGNPDRRFGPARAENAPIRQTARLDLATVSGGVFDPDGERVTFTATSDNPAIDSRVSGRTLFLDYDADFATTARITVVATDESGRQARTSFDLNIDGVILTPGDKATSTVLTFNGGFASSAVIDADYGDRVTSATQGPFSYGSGVRGPATPNVVVDYLPVGAVRFWETDYGNLTNVVYRQSGATDPLEIVLTADPGYQVALHGFDLAGWRQTNRPINFLEVLDEAGTELVRRDGITVLGTGGTHSSFDFATPLTGQTLRIRIDPGVSHDNVGIDNLQFSQFEPAEGSRRFVDGSVFLDSNGNGERDGDERGVGGVVVHLLNASGQVLLCTVTDVNGNYRLSAGPATEDHTVEVILPSRWRSSGIAAVVVTSLESTVDFGVAKPLDIGADRSGVEGLAQTFDLVTDLTLSDIVWEVRQGSDLIATGAAASFIFTPPNEGSYLVSVTARDTASGLFHSDDLWLRVRNAPPLPVILVDGEPTAELTVEQGSSLTLNSLVTDPGPDDWVAHYRWSIIDANGAPVDSVAGSLNESEPVPAWTFDASLAGSFEIRLRVTDNDGAIGISEPLRIMVPAFAPSFDLTSISDKVTDGFGAFAGTLIGPGGDGLLGEADFGDGTRRPVVLRADRSFEAEHRYEQPGRYQVQVRIANEEGETAERSFEVNYDPFAPTAVLAYGNINENVDTSAGPLFVTHLIAEDETPGDSHTFELVAGDGDRDNAAFQVAGNQLMLRQGVDVDFETQDRYTIRVRTTDAVGNWHENSVTIGVNDLIELSKDAITINDGSIQRSRVTSLTIRFDQSVTFSEDAIRVIRRDSAAEVPTEITSRTVDGGVTLVDIHFDNGDSSLVDNWGSLVDGAYELNIDGSRILNDQGFGLDAQGNGRTDETFRFGDEATDDFFRLLGDGNGDRFVNSGDFRGFRATYLEDPQSEAFNPAYDLNHDGVINSADFRLFRQQYLKGIPHANDD